jgi:HAD superfamily hydrolase (TIGR01490 family)
VSSASPERRPVAAFDFDGTIARRDTLMPFLASVVGRGAFLRAALGRAPQLARVAAGRADRDAEKEVLIGRLLAGRAAAEVATAGTAYAERLWTAQRFRPDMLERLAWHRAEGHRIVIVSASLDAYLLPLAPRLGVDHVISCSLAAENGVLTGTLVGGNVRGAEKVRRLESWLAGEPVELWAYGDSVGDDELLARADHPTRVER